MTHDHDMNTRQLWIMTVLFFIGIGIVLTVSEHDPDSPDPLRTELDSLRTELDAMRVKYDAIRNELIRCEGREVGREMARNLVKNGKK